MAKLMDREAQPDQHGFVLMGRTDVHGAHLAMFNMPEHTFQVVIRLALGADGSGQDARQKYLDALDADPSSPVIVVNPESHKMLLSDMIDRGSFPAEIWQLPDNDFGKRRVVTTGLDVRVQDVLQNRRFDPTETPPDRPRYQLFGTPQEAHLAHYMSWEPDYQLVLDATQVHGLSEDELRWGTWVELTGIAEDHSPTSDPMARYRNRPIEAVAIERGSPVSVTVGATRWFDTKYLNMPSHGVQSIAELAASAAPI